MIHLIYTHDNKFVGYTESDEKLKLLKKERGSHKYQIMTVPDESLNKLKRNESRLSRYGLDYYPEFGKLLFEYEVTEMSGIASERVIDLHLAYVDLHRHLRFIKFTKAEKETIDRFLHLMGLMFDDLMGDSHISFTEYLDVTSIYTAATSKPHNLTIK